MRKSIVACAVLLPALTATEGGQTNQRLKPLDTTTG
jgi:hypothetical protein